MGIEGKNCLRLKFAVVKNFAQKVLDEKLFEEYISRALQLAIDSCDEMIACPSCGVVVERVQRHGNQINVIVL